MQSGASAGRERVGSLGKKKRGNVETRGGREERKMAHSLCCKCSKSHKFGNNGLNKARVGNGNVSCLWENEEKGKKGERKVIEGKRSDPP